MKVISVFGSAATQPNTPDYMIGLEVGRALAQHGYAVMTGGYDGMMRAVSEGAHAANGRVVGVTAESLQKLRPHLEVNPFVNDHVHHYTLHERLLHLVTRADGYVVLPGGLGTLTEIALVWELMRVKDIPANPFIFYGAYWQQVLDTLAALPYVQAQKDGAWSVLSHVDSIEALLARLGQGASDSTAAHDTQRG
jgi:uncharacterized protein (TIGR00730 family)